MIDDKMKDTVQAHLMYVSHKFFQANFTKMSQMDLHPGQMAILHLLEENPDLTQRELSKRLKTKPPTVNVSIQRLEKRGLVTKRADEKDRRITRVSLTEKGKELNRQTVQLIWENEAMLTRGFTEEEIETYKALSKRLSDNIELANPEEINPDQSCSQKPDLCKNHQQEKK